MTTERELARGLLRQQGPAVLSVWDPAAACPYGALVVTAAEPDGRPLLLLSRLSVHRRLLEQHEAAALTIVGAGAQADPLAGPRLTVQGACRPHPEPRAARARFVAAHPAAELYAGFADFAPFRLNLRRGHLVAGFGRVRGFPAADLLD